MTPARIPSEASTQQQARTRKDKQLIAALVALLSAGATGYGFLVGVRSALIAWGATFQIASWVGELVSHSMSLPDLGVGDVGPMQKLQRRQAFVWRSIYALSAAERLGAASDLAQAQSVEVGYFERHVAAEERRDRAAALVDVTARLLGDRREEQPSDHVPLLSWRAVIDRRTTPACRWANGQNYRADRIPVIGLPGAVHPRCRCTSGPPIAGASLIPSA